MKIIELDGSRMNSVENVHQYLKADSELPAYEGEDLQDMRDMLSEISENTFIFVLNSERMQAALGDYSSRIIKVWKDLEQENKHLCFFMR